MLGCMRMSELVEPFTSMWSMGPPHVPTHGKMTFLHEILAERTWCAFVLSDERMTRVHFLPCPIRWKDDSFEYMDGDSNNSFEYTGSGSKMWFYTQIELKVTDDVKRLAFDCCCGEIKQQDQVLLWRGQTMWLKHYCNATSHALALSKEAWRASADCTPQNKQNASMLVCMKCLCSKSHSNCLWLMSYNM